MKLTGKALIDFKIFYQKIFDETGDYPRFDYFKYYPLSLQYGVYVDFFDGVGIFIQDILYNSERPEWQLLIDCEEDDSMDVCLYDFKTRQETNIKAIEIANEIYNTLEQ